MLSEVRGGKKEEIKWRQTSMMKSIRLLGLKSLHPNLGFTTLPIKFINVDRHL